MQWRPLLGERLQRLGQPLRRAIAVVRPLGQRQLNHASEIARNVWVEAANVGRPRMHLLIEHGDRGGADVRRTPRQRLVQDAAERVDVRARIDVLAFRLLGGHVFRCADGGAGLGEAARAKHLRDAEVRQQHVPRTLCVDQHVGRLDVTMHDAAQVGVVKRVRHLDHRRDRFAGGQRPAQLLAECAAEHALHDEVDNVVVFAAVKDGDDVGVIELRDGLHLALEALDKAHAVVAVVGNDLDGDITLHLSIAATIDTRRAATADFFENRVLAELAPDQIIPSHRSSRPRRHRAACRRLAAEMPSPQPDCRRPAHIVT